MNDRTEKAFNKLKSAIGIKNLEEELILIDTLTKPSQENERKISEFIGRLRYED